jgi:hypothetical protein
MAVVMWRHLTNSTIYNKFYGRQESYVIEYPISFEYFDQILQDVSEFTRAYKYKTTDAKYSTSTRIETDDDWYNKSIVYNGQQCSGLLNLVPKPRNNLKEYMSYPKFESNGKTIIFTKKDSMYWYNTFWDVIKDKSDRMFVTTCRNMSIDKVLNQSNMDYSVRSYRKYKIRAKDIRIRHILDNKSDVLLVSRLLFTSSQISYV